MATVAHTSNGLAVNINASKFNHVYLTYRGKTYEIFNFVNGQALTGQRTNPSGTLTEDYEGNGNHFESASHSGTITLNILADSDWHQDFLKIYHAQHDDMTPENAADTFVDLTYKNDLSGETMVGEKCRFANIPNADMSNNVATMAWTLNATFYDIKNGNGGVL